MKITLNASDFSKAVATAAKALSNNPTVPALAFIRLNAAKGYLVLVGSDGEKTIRVAMKEGENGLKIEEEGLILVEGKLLQEISKKLAAIGGTVTVSRAANSASAKIVNGEYKYTVRMIDSAAYPNIDMKKTEVNFTIDRQILKDTISQIVVASAFGRMKGKPVLDGMHIIVGNGELVMEATDSHRWAKRTMPWTGDVTVDKTIPAETIGLAVSLLEDDQITVGIDEKKARISDSHTMIQTRIFADDFPDMSKLMPTQFGHIVKVDRVKMLGAVDRCSLMKTEGNILVRMILNKDGVMEIRSTSPEVGDYNETLNVHYEGDGLSITVNGADVMDALKAVGGEEVTISLIGALKPFLVTGATENLFHLLCPVRSYD